MPLSYLFLLLTEGVEEIQKEIYTIVLLDSNFGKPPLLFSPSSPPPLPSPPLPIPFLLPSPSSFFSFLLLPLLLLLSSFLSLSSFFFFNQSLYIYSMPVFSSFVHFILIFLFVKWLDCEWILSSSLYRSLRLQFQNFIFGAFP